MAEIKQKQEETVANREDAPTYGEALARRVAKALLSSNRKDLIAGDGGLGLRWTERKMFEIPMSAALRRDWQFKVSSGQTSQEPSVLACCGKPPEPQDKGPHVVVVSAPKAWGPKAYWTGKKLPCIEMGDTFLSGEELMGKVGDLKRELNSQSTRVAFPSDEGGFAIAPCADGLVKDEPVILRWATEDEFVAWLAKQSDQSMSGRDPEADIVKLNIEADYIEPDAPAITQALLERYVTKPTEAGCCLQ